MTGRKPGRPKGTHKPPQFTEWLRLRITPEQLQAAQDAASEAGLGLSAYVRGLLPDADPEPAP
tara:strand:+ start:835 stop:1023 length:189 start_codon:yes stop_codon:yes gene_type:complete